MAASGPVVPPQLPRLSDAAAARSAPGRARRRSPQPHFTLVQALQVLLFSFAGLCPVCKRGPMFRSFYTLQEHCLNCGVGFEPDRGEVTGGMAINMVISSILGTALAIYCAAFSGLPPAVAISVIAGVTLTFALVFHRPARSVWVGCLYLTGALHER